ncbi:hypothetical protein [Limnobaculum xujianqingii]|uniref:hypothetical protein n=1 Tax=Limnobaculum xujianqingii TaxID=2738837 RepID=UPI00112A724D|nr:hypothetical protein [Limnobaculum xujianqingii]
MSINVNGDNNRIAGRDYHEHPDICPSCEVRYLTSGRQYCRHCEEDYNRAQTERILRKIARHKLLRRFWIAQISLIISMLLLVASDDYTPYISIVFMISLIACCMINAALKNYPPDDD